MTKILHVPQEILTEVLKHLQLEELIQAQKVCHGWYLPAHELLLKVVYLRSGQEIDQFIVSMDQHTKSSYLSAVEKIVIGNDSITVEYEFNRENVEKLFCRFPKLTDISIHTFTNCVEAFDDDLCQLILKNCPKLDSFDAVLETDRDAFNYEDVYCETLYKFRLIATVIRTDDLGYADMFGGLGPFILSFPRLQRISGPNNPIDSLSRYLYIFTDLSNIKYMTVNSDYYWAYEDEGFAETYFDEQPEQQRNLIIERIANVKELTYSVPGRPFCPNSLKFIAKYLTGLEKLITYSTFNRDDWTNECQHALVNYLTDIKVKKQADMSLFQVPVLVVAEFLPAVIKNLFGRLPSHNKTLLLEARSKDGFYETVDFGMSWPYDPSIKVATTIQTPVDTIVPFLFANEYSEIDHFELYIHKRDGYVDYMGLDTYQIILEAIPSLKSISLDIPASYTSSSSKENFYEHHCLETLTLRSAADVQIQELLDIFASMLPNLVNLNLYSYWGSLSHGIHVYLVLKEYSLQRLSIDATMVRFIMEEQSLEDDFFVIEVKTHVKKQQYKLSSDLSSVTSITEEEAQKYLCIHIDIYSVESLEVWMYTRDDGNEYYLVDLNNLPLGLKHTVIF